MGKGQPSPFASVLVVFGPCIMSDDDNDSNNNNDSFDTRTGASHKRMRPETAALQLLELSGQRSMKRARTIGMIPPRNETVEGEGEIGQRRFGDASLTEQEEEDQYSTRVTGKVRSRSKESLTSCVKSLKDFDQYVIEGQFDDASEDEIYVRDTPPHPWNGQRDETDQSSKRVTTPSPVPWQQIPQMPPRQVAVPLPRYPIPASGITTNPMGHAPVAPASLHHRPHHSIYPLPIAPRPMPVRPKTLADGPLTDHPNPLLEPDTTIDDHLRLRTMPPVLSDTEYRKYPVYQPLPTDILLGRGGRSNHHAGNEWFREFVQVYRPTYHRIGKFNKMQLATNLVNYVRHCNGRFLQQVKIPIKTTTTTTTSPQQLSIWFEVGDVRAREKCSQCLREAASDGSSRPAAVGNAKTAGTRNSSSRRTKSVGGGGGGGGGGSSTSTGNDIINHSSSSSRVGTPRTVPSRRPSTTSTITTHATETDGLLNDEQESDRDDPGMLTI